MKVIKVRPHLIHVHIVEMVNAFSSVVRVEVTILEPALAESSGARLVVLFQTRINHQCFTLLALHPYIVLKARSIAILARDERLITTQRAGLQMRNAGRAETTATSKSLAGTCADLSAHGTLEPVAHFHVL